MKLTNAPNSTVFTTLPSIDLAGFRFFRDAFDPLDGSSMDSALTADTLIVPSSSMSIFAPVVSQISRMTLPPVPITSRILSVGIFSVTICGANFES
jgi:hypothetical protein